MYSLTIELSVSQFECNFNVHLDHGDTYAATFAHRWILKMHFGARGGGCLGLNDPWESHICSRIFRGSAHWRANNTRVTQHERSGTCLCSHVHASVSLSCLCGKDAIRSKSNSGTTRPKCHVYLLHYYWMVTPRNKCSQWTVSLRRHRITSFLTTSTQRKAERFHIPQQVSFQRVWPDVSKMSGWTGAAVVAVNGWAVRVKRRPPHPRSSEDMASPFQTGHRC